MSDFNPALATLCEAFEAEDELDTPRSVQPLLDGAPVGINHLVKAMQSHAWNAELGDYECSDEGHAKVLTLEGIIDFLADDMNYEFEEGMECAGPGGESFNLDRTLALAPDSGGTSHLGIAWSDRNIWFVVAELEEDPNEPGLLKHLLTPGALFKYLEEYLKPDDDQLELVAAMKSATADAGVSVDPAEPELSQPPD